MRYQINFCNSSVCSDDRPRILARLNEIATAWRVDDCADYAFHVEVSSSAEDKVRKILRELANRGCWIYSFNGGDFILWRRTTERAILRYRKQLAKRFGYAYIAGESL